MKNQNLTNFLHTDTDLRELNTNETSEINGGFLPLVLVAVEVYAGVCLLSYAAGAATAYAEKAIKKIKK